MSKTTTIIAPAYCKLDVISELLKNSDLLMGTEIVPLNVFRSNLVSYLGSQTAEFSRLFRKVQHNVSIPTFTMNHSNTRPFSGTFMISSINLTASTLMLTLCLTMTVRKYCSGLTGSS